MTSTRRQRKSWGEGLAAQIVLLSGLWLSWPFLADATLASPAATTEQIVSNANTGLAIDGIDPVAYFVDARPIAGLPEYEYRYGGAIWRFRNIGNLAAFRSDPEVYMPRYGGYDPLAVVRGVAVPGNPLLWVVYRGRLYLFHSQAAREQFIADPRAVVAAAEARWGEIASKMVP